MAPLSVRVSVGIFPGGGQLAAPAYRMFQIRPTENPLKGHCRPLLSSGIKAREEIFERIGWKTERNSTLRGPGREQTRFQDIV